MPDSYAAWRTRFAEALDPKFYTIEYLDELIASQQALFVTNGKAAIVVEIKTFPTGKTAISGVIAAGQLAEIENALIPYAENLGRSLGCSFSMIESRPGWARKLKNSGYDVFQVSLVKEL